MIVIDTDADTVIDTGTGIDTDVDINTDIDLDIYLHIGAVNQLINYLFFCD